MPHLCNDRPRTVRRQVVDDQLHVEVFYAALGPLFALCSKRPNGTTMTFQQRYCLYDKFSNHKASSTDAPPPNILFYTGNESPVEEYVNQTGLMWTLAPKLNSLVVFAEHRYFGVCTATERRSKLPGLPHPSKHSRTTPCSLEVKRNSRSHTQKSLPLAVPAAGCLQAGPGSYPNVFAGASSARRSGVSLLTHRWTGSEGGHPGCVRKGGSSDNCKDNIRYCGPLSTTLKTQDGRDYLSSVLNVCKPPEPSTTSTRTWYAQALWFNLAEGDYLSINVYYICVTGDYRRHGLCVSRVTRIK